MTVAEHHEHRESRADAVRRAVADRPGAQWSPLGRTGFVDAVAAQPREEGVPARSVHEDAFWTMRTPPATHRDGLVGA